MKPNNSPPFAVVFLVLPYGISTGFATVTLPYLLIHHGFSVAATASITALGLSANLYRFIWAPLTDLTWSLKRWYLIGVLFCSITLLGLCFTPIVAGDVFFLSAVLLLSQVASTFVVAPVGGLMAKTILDEKKGRAGGWFQAGNLAGMGIGGGAGIWLSTHFSVELTGVVLASSMLACALALTFFPDVRADNNTGIKRGFNALVIDLKDLFKSRLAVFTILMILTPIGIGAASYVWSSIGSDWRVKAETVAIVTGALSGVVSAFGCMVGGWVADKLGGWYSFFGSGIAMALVTLFMFLAPLSPIAYITGVLFYSFTFGSASAAFSAVALFAIGKNSASTKYALISTISNVAPVYMTALDGWLHDAYSVKIMLMGETFLGLLFVAISLAAFAKLNLTDKGIMVNYKTR